MDSGDRTDHAIFTWSRQILKEQSRQKYNLAVDKETDFYRPIMIGLLCYCVSERAVYHGELVESLLV